MINNYMLGILKKILGRNKSTSGQEPQSSVAVRSNFGRQEEKVVGGKNILVRKNADEKFSGAIKDVPLEEMHEEYYDVDVLKKN